MSSSEELWQAYDLSGEPTEHALTKAEARTGVLHGASHVWIWRTEEKGVDVLLQQRAKDKMTWPNHLDISTAGHIDFGETPIVAALREAQEEIGLAIDKSRLELLFVHHASMLDASTEIIENEFQWVYSYELSEDVKLTFADGEVSAVLWLPLDEFRELASGKKSQYQVVPHGMVYFGNLTAALNSLTDGK